MCDVKPTGGPRLTTDEFSSCAVIREVTESSDLSIRRLAHLCHTTRYAVHRILKERKFRRYSAPHVQVLNHCDPERRHHFCRWFLNNVDIRSVLFTDESVFRLHGAAAKRHFGAMCNSRRYNASCTQLRAKLIIWAGFIDRKIVGPFFFSSNVTGMSSFHY